MKNKHNMRLFDILRSKENSDLFCLLSEWMFRDKIKRLEYITFKINTILI